MSHRFRLCRPLTTPAKVRFAVSGTEVIESQPTIMAISVYLLAVVYIAVYGSHTQFSAAQPSPAPGPAATSTVTPGNTTGSIADYCSTRANLQSLLSSSSNQASAGLGVTIPANLTDSADIQSIAQVDFCTAISE